MTPRFSIIIPTIGRSSLTETLTSIAYQATAEDEVIVVGDGKRLLARRIVEWFSRDLSIVYQETPEARDWGATPRARALQLAQCSHILQIDDDDVFMPDAFITVRRAVLGHPNRALMFRIVSRSGLIWRTPEVKPGNVGTGCLVIPNDPARFGAWTNRYEGDYDFIVSTLGNFPDPPIWREEVLIKARALFGRVLCDFVKA